MGYDLWVWVWSATATPHVSVRDILVDRFGGGSIVSLIVLVKNEINVICVFTKQYYYVYKTFMQNYDCQVFPFIRVLQHEVPIINFHGMTGTSTVHVWVWCGNQGSFHNVCPTGLPNRSKHES